MKVSRCTCILWMLFAVHTRNFPYILLRQHYGQCFLIMPRYAQNYAGIIGASLQHMYNPGLYEQITEHDMTTSLAYGNLSLLQIEGPHHGVYIIMNNL